MRAPQSTWPLSHWHTPLTHAEPAGQALPQVPQLVALFDRFRQPRARPQ
jgi:hypothetical protein